MTPTLAIMLAVLAMVAAMLVVTFIWAATANVYYRRPRCDRCQGSIIAHPASIMLRLDQDPIGCTTVCRPCSVILRRLGWDDL